MDSGINVAVTVAFLAIIVQYLIERVRSRFPSLDGDVVALGAIVLGTGLAVVYGINAAAILGMEGLPLSLDYLVTGISIAGFSGILASSKNANRALDPSSSMYEGTDLH